MKPAPAISHARDQRVRRQRGDDAPRRARAGCGAPPSPGASRRCWRSRRARRRGCARPSPRRAGGISGSAAAHELGQGGEQQLLDFLLQGVEFPLPPAARESTGKRRVIGRLCATGVWSRHRLEQLERIDVERPAHRARLWQLLDLRQPGVEEGRAGARARRSRAAAARGSGRRAGHGRRHRARAAARPGSRAPASARASVRKRERRLARLGASRAAPPGARTAATAPARARRAPPARSRRSLR